MFLRVTEKNRPQSIWRTVHRTVKNGSLSMGDFKIQVGIWFVNKPVTWK